MLALRRQWLVPLLAGQRGPGRFEAEGGLLRIAWTLADTTRGEDGPQLHLIAHFGDAPVDGIAPPAGETLYANALERDGSGTLRLARGAVLVTLEQGLRSSLPLPPGEGWGEGMQHSQPAHLIEGPMPSPPPSPGGRGSNTGDRASLREPGVG
jgi:hypothetical protein